MIAVAHDGPSHVTFSITPPTGRTLARFMRLDQNGRTLWTGAQLAHLAPTYYGIDRTVALEGPVEYVAIYDDDSLEATTLTMPPTDGRPRLLRLDWTQLAGRTVLASGGTLWTEHDAVIDATYDQQDVSTVTRRGAAGLHSTRNHDRTDTGRLVIWCTSHAAARNLRDDLLTHPVQWLRAPDQPGMDHALIVTGLAIRTEAEAWMIDLTYESRPDLVPVPDALNGTWGKRTLADHSGTLGSIAATFDMLAEMR